MANWNFEDTVYVEADGEEPKRLAALLIKQLSGVNLNLALAAMAEAKRVVDYGFFRTVLSIS
jgi:hypothetical protein